MENLIEKVETKPGLVDDYPGNYEPCQRCFLLTLKDLLKEHPVIQCKGKFIRVCPQCFVKLNMIFGIK